jgi:hypothetical protein
MSNEKQIIQEGLFSTASNFVNDFFDGLKSNATNRALEKARQNKLPQDVIDVMEKIKSDGDELRDLIKKYSKYKK